jgi:hypothetical protein
MLFRLVDHYRDDDFIKNVSANEKNTCVDECFVCLSVELYDEVSPIKLRGDDEYLRGCCCDGFIHRKCLDDWYAVSGKCPVCRLYMEKKIHPPRIAVICLNIVTVLCRMLWLVGWVLYAWTAVNIYMTKRRLIELEDMNYNIDDDMNDEI